MPSPLVAPPVASAVVLAVMAGGGLLTYPCRVVPTQTWPAVPRTGATGTWSNSARGAVGILRGMDTPAEHLDEATVEHLAVTLRRRRTELADADGARIGQGTVVHGLTTHMWAGIEVPAVQCHAAVDPLRLYPAPGPVTCRRCLGRARAEQVPGQTSLL